MVNKRYTRTIILLVLAIFSIGLSVATISDIEMDSLDSQYEPGETFTATGTVYGTQIDRVDLQNSLNYGGSETLGTDDGFGDCNNGCDISITHDFEEEGTYELFLRAVSGDQRENSDTRTIEVASEDEERAQITVTVEDDDGNQIEDADVDVGGESEKTDSDGQVTIDLDPGSYTLEASKDRYESDSRGVYLSPGEEQEETLTLQRIPEKAELRVYTGEPNRDGPENVDVTVDGKTENTGNSDRVEFELDAGSYDITASENGEYAESSITLDEGEKETVHLGLPTEEESDEATLTVNTEDGDGHELEHADVTVDGETKDSGNNGRVRFNLESGSYTIEASKDGYSTETRGVYLSPQEEQTETLNLDRQRDEGRCDASAGRIQIEDDFISEDESTEASITVDNSGDSQRFDVKIYSEEETYLDVARTFTGERTFDADIRPENDVNVRAEVKADGGPCYNREWSSGREVIVTEAAENYGELIVDVEDEDNNNLEDARVRIENRETHEKDTGSNGRAYFELAEDEYSIEVSKDGYVAEEENIDFEAESDTVYFHLASEDEDDRDEDEDDIEEFELTVRTENEDGERVRDALVNVQNGVDLSRRTGDSGEADFTVEEGTYDVRSSKDGYGAGFRTVEVNSDTTRTVVLGEGQQNLDIIDVSHPNDVCRGGSMTADVEIENTGDTDQQVDLEGSGLGRTVTGPSVIIEEGETRTVSMMLTNIEGDGRERFSVSVTSDLGYDSSASSITVENCGTATGTNARDISMDLSPDRVLSNEPVKVKGYVDGTRGRSEVTVNVDGQERGKVNTQPDGYYQTYIRVEEVGEHSVSVSTDSISANRDLEVLPKASVSIKNSPSQAFEGENFELCADVSSQVEPEVILLRNGEVMQTKNEQGEVCFSTTAGQKGEYNYQIRAITYGTGSSAKARVNVLESGPETTSFPDQIAAVESESGLVKTELYNTHTDLRRYDIRLEGLPDDWFSTSQKQVMLNSGERETVYFYVVPKDEGNYNGEIVVEAEGSEIYREEITVRSGGTTDPQRGSKSWWSRVKGLWPF